MQFLAILSEPGFLSVVVRIHVDDLWVPVCFLTGDIVAALKNQDPLPGWCEMKCERSTTRARADNNYVIPIVGHDANPPLAPQNMQRLSLSWWSLQHLRASRPRPKRKPPAENTIPGGGPQK